MTIVPSTLHYTPIKYLMCGAKERQSKSSGITIIITSDNNNKRRKMKHPSTQ
jgi:hypothetical protein